MMPFINGSGSVKIKNQTRTYQPIITQQVLLSPDDGYDAFDQVLIGPLSLQSKTIRANGVFVPDEGFIAFGNVTIKASSHACYTAGVQNENEDRFSCIFTIPTGDNDTLPSTILIHRTTVGSTASNLNDPKIQIKALMLAILNKNDTGYDVTCIGHGGHTFDGVVMVVDIVGTISNADSISKVSFAPTGMFVSHSTTSKTVTFEAHPDTTFDMISIWN